MVDRLTESAQDAFVREHTIAHRARRAFPDADRWWNRISIFRMTGYGVPLFKRSVDEYDRHTRRIGPVIIHTLECCGCTCGDLWAEPEGREPASKEVNL